MPPPLSGEARVTVPSLLVFYTFFATLIYNKLIVSEEVSLPPLKGEVAKIDNFNCQFLTEGSRTANICSVPRKIRNLFICGNLVLLGIVSVILLTAKTAS